MNDWDAYLQELASGDLWGFVLLDRYQIEGHDNPADFMRAFVLAVDLSDVDPVAFHNVLLETALQLMRDDFDEVASLSATLLRRLGSLSRAQLSRIRDQ